MEPSELNKFGILLWKNFTLKRRQFIALSVEITLTLLFAGTLLFTRQFVAIVKKRSVTYAAIPIDDLPDFFQVRDSLLLSLELGYVPSKSTVAKTIVEQVKMDLNMDFKVHGFSSEKDFENYIMFENNSRKMFAGIVFDHEFKHGYDSLPLKVKYYLRPSGFGRSDSVSGVYLAKSWRTALLFPPDFPVGPRNPYDATGGQPGYINEGFLLLQHSVDKAIMSYHNRDAAEKLFSTVSIFAQRFPYPAYHHDMFFTFSGVFIPLVVLFIFSVNHFTLIRSIVWEKENRLKEYQLMIGLSNWMLWAAYFITFLILNSIVVFLMCLVFFIKIDSVPVIQFSDPSLIFVFFVCFAIASIFFTFMVSTFFNKANYAVSLGGFLYFATYFPYHIVFENYGMMTHFKKLACCLSSNIAMALGIQFLVKAETDNVGIKWSNFLSAPQFDNFAFAYVLGMLLFDAFLYGLVTWYIEAVFPGQYGIPKPWNFFMMRSYWFGGSTKKNNERSPFYETFQSKYFEAEPTDLVPGIQIKHLHKTFQLQNSTKIAVKDLCLNLYEGQITVLLGHNGAGKSTTLSILSGLYPPTTGTAYINGYDILKDMVHIRKNLGLCPQQDLLFNYLTVSEHLYFYCVIKGIRGKLRAMEIDHMLSAFNLLEKRNAYSQSLSGGMKRKLSIIIALIGGSKVVILDEPTSGMDTVSRRVTWDLLQQYKQDRTILLTTHYMEEADALGDRIAIMVKGTLKCCGSSVFLKQIYGVGYHIIMVKEPHCNTEKISKLLRQHIPEAILENNVQSELSYILPKEYTHRFEFLFAELEARQKELGIASFGASITTMEEVFFRVSSKEESQDTQLRFPVDTLAMKNQNVNYSAHFEGTDPAILTENSAIQFNTGWPLYHQQFCAMFKKRAMYSWRGWRLLLLQILGLLGVITFLLQVDDFSKDSDVIPRQMNLAQYGRTIVPVSISGNSNLTQNLFKQLSIKLKSENQILRKVEGDLVKYLIGNKDCIHLCIVALSIEEKTDRTVLTAFFNNEAYHSPSASLALLDNILFISLSGPDASITVSNKPQPYSDSMDVFNKNTHGTTVALSVQFGMALLISGFCLLTVTERVTKVKHIQFLSGMYLLTYWISALLWDFIVFFISCCLLLGVFKYCEAEVFVIDNHALDTMLIFMVYGWSAIPFMYLMSFLFSESTNAYIKLILFNYFSGIFSLLIEMTLQYNMEVESRISETTRTLILDVLLLFPNYNLAKALEDYSAAYRDKALCYTLKYIPPDINCSAANIHKNVYSLKDDMIGSELIVMGTLGFVIVFLIFLCETTLWKLKAFVNRHIYFGLYKIFRKDIVSKELSGESQDEDVGKERNRILELPTELLDTTILIKELIKIYFKCPVILAVKNISLRVQKGECFGLLGFNGAGKTSVFKILTGESSATSGDVRIEGYSITRNIQEVRSRIGYCPQSDALLDYMTGRETLLMYARIWGVSEPQIDLYVNSWLKSLHLEPHADKYVFTYSGGNKRKLSTAIALMGKPSAIFLDEPSAGMDPVARHWLWNLITQMREYGKVIIITSHSMEECEALCTRLAIMVKGKFMCLGSPQHLKSKFGHVYILKGKVKPDVGENKLEDFKMFITTTFPGSVLKHENNRTVDYYIPSKDNSWAKVFGVLEGAKEQFYVEDYSISQITLEQVFLTFAHPDKTEEEYKAMYQEINL